MRHFFMILSPNMIWRKIFFHSCQRPCDKELIIVRIFYFQIWNKNNEHDIIIYRVINSHMGLKYIETPSIIAEFWLKICV